MGAVPRLLSQIRQSVPAFYQSSHELPDILQHNQGVGLRETKNASDGYHVHARNLWEASAMEGTGASLCKRAGDIQYQCTLQAPPRPRLSDSS